MVAALAALATAMFHAGPAFAEDPDPPATGLIVVHMDEQNGSGIDGRAEIMPADDGAKTFVQVFINQVQPGSSYAAMLHLGCTGPIEVNLSPVVAKEATTGRSVTTVDLPFSQVADGKHVVAVHGGDGKAISCGQIPAQPAARKPEVLPPSGSGTAGSTNDVTTLTVLLVAGVAMMGTGAALRLRPRKE